MAHANIKKPRQVTDGFGSRRDRIKAEMTKKRSQQIIKAKKKAVSAYKTSKKATIVIIKGANRTTKKADKLASVLLRGFKW